MLLCGASKGFMKALKALIKPFEAPQRSVEIKIQCKFLKCTGQEGLRFCFFFQMRLLQSNDKEICNPSVKRKACKHSAALTQELLFCVERLYIYLALLNFQKAFSQTKL